MIRPVALLLTIRFLKRAIELFVGANDANLCCTAESPAVEKIEQFIHLILVDEVSSVHSFLWKRIIHKLSYLAEPYSLCLDNWTMSPR